MESLRKKYEQLESETYTKVSELLNKREQGLILATEDYNDCDIADVYDEINGGTFSVYVVGITKGGMIEGRDVEDGREEDYKLSDLASLLDRINIAEILEANQNN